jgi:hypothetical protein
MTVHVPAGCRKIRTSSKGRGGSDRRLQELRQNIRGPLRFVSTLDLGSIGSFCADDVFRVGTPVGDYKIAWLGDNFRAHFLKLSENDMPATKWHVWQLTAWCTDREIIETLGGEIKSESRLARIFQVMQLGRTGRLLTNGYANIAYVRSALDDHLWAVDCSVDSRGWCVEASRISDPNGWRAGRRVFGG